MSNTPNSKTPTRGILSSLPSAYSNESSSAHPTSPQFPNPFIAKGGLGILGSNIVSHRIETSSDLGRMVRDIRKNSGLSQQQFADLAGVGRRFLSELENGKDTLEFGKLLKVLQSAGIQLIASGFRK